MNFQGFLEEIFTTSLLRSGSYSDNSSPRLDRAKDGEKPHKAWSGSLPGRKKTRNSRNVPGLLAKL